MAPPVLTATRTGTPFDVVFQDAGDGQSIEVIVNGSTWVVQTTDLMQAMQLLGKTVTVS